MSADCLKLTSYFGERDRAGDVFLADALIDCYARHELAASLVMRGVEGFGAKHQLRTDRLLTLSEDLPLVSVAVDRRQRIEAVLPEVVALSGDGLMTLERARMPAAHVVERAESTKVTVYVGRGLRVGRHPAHVAIVDLLHQHGVAGATVLLGVDGTFRGRRRRATFFGANARVPLMIVSVGDGEPMRGALTELCAVLDDPLVTVERVRVCKRDGRRLAEPQRVPETDPSGLGCGRSSWSTARSNPGTTAGPFTSRSCTGSGLKARWERPRRAGSGATTATIARTATPSGSCSAASPSSPSSSTRRRRSGAGSRSSTSALTRPAW